METKRNTGSLDNLPKHREFPDSKDERYSDICREMSKVPRPIPCPSCRPFSKTRPLLQHVALTLLHNDRYHGNQTPSFNVCYGSQSKASDFWRPPPFPLQGLLLFRVCLFGEGDGGGGIMTSSRPAQKEAPHAAITKTTWLQHVTSGWARDPGSVGGGGEGTTLTSGQGWGRCCLAQE